MKLDIDSALKNAGEIFHAELEGWLDSGDLPYECSYAEPVKAVIDYTLSDDGLFVWGKLTTSIGAFCARCLKKIIYPVETEFSEVFKDAPDDEDDEAYIYEGEEISIDKMLSDRISLVLPVRFLCRDDCKGLCQHCGADLNEGECGCGDGEEKPETSPFSGLNGLFD